MQVLFICWVATVVPYRICFDVTIELASLPFWIDAFIDLFFIIDVVLNFRTAFYLPTGFLETDLRQIRKNYIRTWLVASLLLVCFSCQLSYSVSLVLCAVDVPRAQVLRGCCGIAADDVRWTYHGSS